MDKIKTIIVEDEYHALQLLQNMIKEYCPNLELVGIANDLETGLNLFNTKSPDLAFMDIHLAEELSFEILDLIPNLNTKIIFTTADETFALKAFRYEAIDYILKPYNHIDIIRAVQKVKLEKLDDNSINKLAQLISKEKKISTEKIKIQSNNGIILIKPSEILHIESDGSYSTIYTIDGKKYTCSNLLKDYEQKLNSSGFYRIHSSHLINLEHVKQIINEDGSFAIMTNGDKIPISRRNKQEFLKQLTGE